MIQRPCTREQLAGGLHGMLTPPAGKWAYIRLKGGESREARLWLRSGYGFPI